MLLHLNSDIVDIAETGTSHLYLRNYNKD